MVLQELKDLLKESGIVGAGGAGFPTYAKLSYDVNTVILNGAECEPLFRVDQNLLATHTDEILTGLSLVVEAVGAKEGILAYKEHYHDADEAIERVIYKYPRLRKKLLKDGYPAGDEVVLVYETTGMVVPQGGIPINVGAMVMNVETALNVYNAVEKKEPVTYKYLTVGGAVNEPKTLRVPIGTKFGDLLKEAGGPSIDSYKLLVGGPMTGVIGNLNDTMTKTTKGIFVLPMDNPIIELREYRLKVALKRAMGVCSQCRMCTDLCPRNLLGHSIEPHKIMNSLAFGLDYNSEVFVNALACCECNLCSAYSCHQGLNPKAIIADLKGRLRANGVKLPKVDSKVKEEKEFRRVPVGRVVARLKLTKYNVDAPLNEMTLEPNILTIKARQSIGAPVTFTVNKGDKVTYGQVIGNIDEKSLGVFLHSPIDGIISEINKDYLVIRREG